MAFSPSGKLLAVANSRDDTITVYLVGVHGTLKRAPESPVEGVPGPKQLAFTPGRTLVSDNGNGTLSFFSVADGGQLTQLTGSPIGGAGGPSMAISPDGKLIATVGGTALTVPQVSIGNDHVSTNPLPGSPLHDGITHATSVAFNPAGSLIAVANTLPNSVSTYSVLTDSTKPPDRPRFAVRQPWSRRLQRASVPAVISGVHAQRISPRGN